MVNIEDPTIETMNESEDIGMNYTCGLCENTFPAEVELRTHIFNTHKSDKTPSIGTVHKKGSEKCESCGKMISKGNLGRHIAYHHQVKTVECGKCEKMFHTNEVLKIHVESVHNKVRRSKCDSCEKSFSDKHYLKLHIKVGVGPSPNFRN